MPTPAFGFEAFFSGCFCDGRCHGGAAFDALTLVKGVAQPVVEAEEGRVVLNTVQVVERQAGAQQRAHLGRELEGKKHKNS